MTSRSGSTATPFGSAATILRLGRPLFLSGGVVFHAVGVTAAMANGHAIDPVSLLLAQGAITFGQLVTNYSNEYFDQRADAATTVHTPWSGGSRVLPGGEAPPRTALRAAVSCAVAALACGALLALRSSSPRGTFALVLLALLLAWSYSAPPLRLHSRTLGEVFGALLLAGLTPLFGYYVQAGLPPAPVLLYLAPLLVLQFAMLLTVSLPDIEGDRSVGKQTLAVRIGLAAAGRLTAVLTLAALTLPLVWWSVTGGSGLFAAALAVWLPVALWQARRLWRLRADPPWSSLGFWGIGLVMGPATTLSLALVSIALVP